MAVCEPEPSLDIFPIIAVGMPVARHPRTDHDPPDFKCTQIPELIYDDEYAHIPFNDNWA
jgi:hypothetical protein